jgi:formiminoglutamase
MLEAFFTPVEKSITKQYAKASGVLGSELKIHSNKFPSTKNIDIAIIGLGKNADLCRRELYALQYHFSGIEVADFGNLNHDGSDKNLLDGMRECIFALREENIIPIFIGENFNYSEALYKSINYQKTDIALVSPYIAYNPDELAWKLEQKKKLFHTSFIGIQNFLNSQTTIQLSSDIFSEQIRLGDLRSNIGQVEPLLRQADLFEFDLRAIKYSNFNSASTHLPSGLSNQEACAICRYAGISNTIGLYLFNHFELNETHASDAQQIAQMIWYTLDGIAGRFNDMPMLNNRNFTVYKCHAHSGEDMLFLYSELSGRWWMQVPQLDKKKKTAPKFIGCSENDHQVAEQGEVPEKWYRASGL